MKLPRLIASCSLVFTLALLLVSCSSKINQENFDKIQVGMSEQEVAQILGPPTDTASVSIGDLSGSSSTWKAKHARIDIQFLNGQVKIKNFSKGEVLDEEEQDR